MATKRPRGKSSTGKKKRRRKKLRLTLKSRNIKETDTYTDRVGWETSRTLDDPNAGAQPTEPEFLRHQCSLCGSIMQAPKPKRARYTITCPNCEHEDSFE
jgi:hypothetical protein